MLLMPCIYFLIQEGCLNQSETFSLVLPLLKLQLSISVKICGTLVSFSLSPDTAVRMAYLFETSVFLSERLNGFFTVFQVLILTNIILGIYLFGS